MAFIVFNATNQRQRAGLLLENGNVYAAFASFCDFKATATPSIPISQTSRGWLLGWSSNGIGALTPLGANQLNDRQGSSPTSYFLDSIWMSGAAPASDELGNLFFSTGNSDGASANGASAMTSTWKDTAPCSQTGLPCSNVQESVVKLKGNLTGIVGLFSPNKTFGSFDPDTLFLDQKDLDLGSGGVLALPEQLGKDFLAVAAGKDGRLFLLDRASPGDNSLKLLQTLKKLQTNSIEGGCFCAPAYFIDQNGAGHVVTSQGTMPHIGRLNTWQVNLTPPSLSLEGESTITSGQFRGFFTTVSCVATGLFGSCTSGSTIIWAVSRPNFDTFGTAVFLYAFSGLVNSSGSYTQLFVDHAGSWPVSGADANIVPTVSNGRVYVASYSLLTIFGVGPLREPLPPLPIASLPSTFAISGILQEAVTGSTSGVLEEEVTGSTLTLKNRKGTIRSIDVSRARANGTVAAALTPGTAYTAVGETFTSAGALLADAIYRAKGLTGDAWPPDKDLDRD